LEIGFCSFEGKRAEWSTPADFPLPKVLVGLSGIRFMPGVSENPSTEAAHGVQQLMCHRKEALELLLFQYDSTLMLDICCMSCPNNELDCLHLGFN